MDDKNVLKELWHFIIEQDGVVLILFNPLAPDFFFNFSTPCI